MSLRNRFASLSIAIFCLAFLVACNSSSNKGTAPPTGGYSNSDLNGTYVFSTTGLDVSGDLISFAGVFTASGSGQISSGTLDVVDPNFSPSVVSGATITGGQYNVGADGRPESNGGILTLIITGNQSFTFDFVLSSTQGGAITYYDPNTNYGCSGSGSFALQSTVAQSNIDGQAYTFNTTGTDSAGNPFAIIGAFTLDANGQIGITTSGVEDVNDNEDAVCSAGAGCTITTGSVSVANVPGTATFSSTPGTFSYDVFPVDATHFKFIETDGAFFTAGDAFTQSSSISSGNNVFSLAGLDYSSSSGAAPLAAVGLLVTDGNGNVTNASTEDINDAGTANEITGYTGTYSSIIGGRSLITLNGFVKGDGGLGCTNCQFAAYPSTGGVQFLEIDDAGFTDGVAYPQSSGVTFASGVGYGMDLTGTNAGNGSGSLEEDDIAEFTNSSGTLTGLIDFNDQGSTSFAQTYAATYAPDTSGISGRGTITGATGNTYSYDMVTYAVDTSLTLGIVSDSNMVALGTLNTQSGTTAASPAARRMVMPRIPPHAKAMKKHATTKTTNK
jgi:hypothetical protein